MAVQDDGVYGLMLLVPTGEAAFAVECAEQTSGAARVFGSWFFVCKIVCLRFSAVKVCRQDRGHVAQPALWGFSAVRVQSEADGL